MAVEECAYCGREVPAVPAPGPRDAEGWADLAGHHAPRCEWVLTRAHTRDAPRAYPSEGHAARRRRGRGRVLLTLGPEAEARLRALAARDGATMGEVVERLVLAQK